MIIIEEERRRKLLEGVVGNDIDLYNRSASFHAWTVLQVESLMEQSRMMVSLAEAERRDFDHRLYEEEHRSLPPWLRISGGATANG